MQQALLCKGAKDSLAGLRVPSFLCSAPAGGKQLQQSVARVGSAYP